MARRVREPSHEKRDWLTRAAEDLSKAQSLPAGIQREDAIKKAEQLRSAGEMMGFLTAGETKSQR